MKYVKPEIAVLDPAIAAVQGTKADSHVIDSSSDTRTHTALAYEADE